MATLASPTADLADAMDDGQPAHAEAGLDLVGDLVQDGQRHGLEGLVGEADDALAGEAGGLGLLAGRGRAGRLARLAQEDDDGAIGRAGDARPEVGQQPVVERGLHDRQASAASAVGSRRPLGGSTGSRAAGDRRDDGQLVAGASALVAVDVAPVAREAHAAPRGRQLREGRHQGRPGRRHVGTLGQLEAVARPARLGALHGEEADLDVHG